VRSFVVLATLIAMHHFGFMPHDTLAQWALVGASLVSAAQDLKEFW
jgi:hypothetical protein